MGGPVLAELALNAIAQGMHLARTYVEPILRSTNGAEASYLEALRENPRLLIVGRIGMGKSSLISHAAAETGRVHLQDPQRSPAPLTVDGSRIRTPWQFEALLLRSVQRVGAATHSDLTTLLEHARLTIYIDDLDESADARHVVHELAEFVLLYPMVNVIATSRHPEYLDRLTNFQQYTLVGWNDAQIVSYIEQTGHHKDLTPYKAFVLAPENRRLISSPLVLDLLLEVAQTSETVPTSIGRLYEFFVDSMLAREAAKQASNRSGVTVEQLLTILDHLAIQFASQRVAEMDVETLRGSIASIEPKLPLDEVMIQLLHNGFFSNLSEGRFGFAHRSFEEFFVSRALKYRAGDVLYALGATIPNEVIEFAFDTLDDVKSIIRAAIPLKLFNIVAKLVHHPSVDAYESAFIVEEFASEFGPHFVNLIKTHQLEEPVKPNEPRAFRLLERYRASRNLNLPAHVRGKAFEEFASDFFGSIFRVVERNLQSGNGELDLVIEMATAGPFWATLTSDAIVECKNWNTGIPISDVNAFIGKFLNTRVRLAFFVSASGFTRDAMDKFRTHASNSSHALLVPIEGREIEEALAIDFPLEEFFKKCVRQIQYLKK